MALDVPPTARGSRRCEVPIRPHTIWDKIPLQYVGPNAAMNVSLLVVKCDDVRVRARKKCLDSRNEVNP